MPGWPLPAFAAAGLAGLLVAVSLAAPARADELPKDTNQIKSLTPEQARKLVEHALTEQIIQRYPDERSRAMVVNHKETVEILESWARLRLNGLTTLDAETAKALALFKGTLELDGLPALTPEAARELVKGHCKFVTIDGLKTLSPDTAQEFVKLRLVAHGIFLPHLGTLDVAAARALAHRPCLSSESQANLSQDADGTDPEERR